MSGKNQHVVPYENKWAIRGEGNSRVTSVFENKSEALQRGRSMASNQRSELVIHGRDGRIQDKDSFGRDPIPPRDRKH